MCVAVPFTYGGRWAPGPGVFGVALFPAGPAFAGRHPFRPSPTVAGYAPNPGTSNRPRPAWRAGLLGHITPAEGSRAPRTPSLQLRGQLRRRHLVRAFTKDCASAKPKLID